MKFERAMALWGHEIVDFICQYVLRTGYLYNLTSTNQTEILSPIGRSRTVLPR
jgi:hypothetical protein